ncbi:MAG: riboflavin synthase, partial [Archangium sp.]|nr:riboflavin synthase [Archangium sp.]
ARADGGSWAMDFSMPNEIAPFFVEKGSVCLDGISLTVTHVGADRFGVMLIPETQQRTSLGKKQPGAKVNVEADIIGKYVARMMGPRGGLSVEQLKAAGLA